MTVLTYDVTGVSGNRTWTDQEHPLGPLPTQHYIESCIARVQSDPALIRALRRERGLTREVASRYGIGHDPSKRAWVLPILNADGVLVNTVWRPHRGEAMRWYGADCDHPQRIRGRTAVTGHLPPFPFVPSQGPILLVAGEWDALAARLHGLPAVTGLLGASWHRAWDAAVVGRRVAVMYDVGEHKKATRTVRKLRRAGAAEAWRVDLPLPEHGDDPERWFRERRYGGYGKSAEELIELITRARPR